jgi:hypothetical protein
MNIVKKASGMNRTNRIRFILSKVQKYQLSGQLDEKYSHQLGVACSDIFNDSEWCAKCIHDDFGYCGLRDSAEPDVLVASRFCFPSIIELFTKELR